MNNQGVSVILPTYNRAYILGQAIESVLNQTYRDLELLIVDDGSTDNTMEVVSGYEDDRIRYCKMENNGGVSAARNYGIAQASYDYVAFEDSDDLWHPEKLEKQMKLLCDSDEKTGFVYHKIRYAMGNDQYAVLPSEQIRLVRKRGNIYREMLYENLVSGPSLLVKKSCFHKVGLYDTSLKALEDYDLALRLSKEFEAEFVDEILLEATYSTGGVSGNSVNFLLASCAILAKFKQDYIANGMLNHRLERIIGDAETIGMKKEFVNLLEKIMQMGEQ